MHNVIYSATGLQLATILSVCSEAVRSEKPHALLHVSVAAVHLLQVMGTLKVDVTMEDSQEGDIAKCIHKV